MAADDSVGMNTITEHERELTATLESLVLEPVGRDARPSARRQRSVALLPAFSVLAVMALIAFSLHLSNAARTVEAEGVTATTLAGRTQEYVTSEPVEQTRSLAPQEVTGSGTVVAQNATTVFARHEGQITGVFVEPGDSVIVGQLLVTLENADARYALEQARTARVTTELLLSARNIDLRQASKRLERTEQLAASELAAKDQLEDASAQAERASNAVAQARQALLQAELAVRIAEDVLDQLTVHAPVAGTITRLDAHVGDTVLARADSVRESQSLLTITDMTSMVIDTDIAETRIAALQVGLRGQAVLDGFPDQPFAVDVLRLAPVVSAEKGTISLRLSLIDPPDRIKPNMAARIRIPVNETGEISP